jgi:putative hydrolase of the HAD superfamily
LDGLSDCQLGIVTNGQGNQQRLKLERTGIRDRFDCVVISEEHGKAKPHPALFQRACSYLGQEPGRSVFVGDIYELDAIGARRAGLVGVWLDRAVTVGLEHTAPIIHSLGELAAVVRRVQLTG